MSHRFLALAAAATLSAASAVAAPVAVDLTTWTGNGSPWALSSGNTVASQTTNSPTSVLHTGRNDLFGRYTGTIGVATSSDDDFIGFVLGYANNDITAGTANAEIDYILVDWKQRAQSGAPEGMAVSRVTGNIYVDGNSSTITTGSDAWTHGGPVTELKRASGLGSVGWDDGVSYDFQVDYTPDVLRVSIDGDLEIELTAAEAGLVKFMAGAFGFYSFSQPATRFSNVTFEELAPIPLPAGLPLAAAGLGALAWLRRRKG